MKTADFSVHPILRQEITKNNPFLPILYFIALWNSDVIDYRKNIILLIILFIFNKLFHGNQVQLSFPLPAIDFYVVICLIITIVFYIRRKNGESKTYFKS